MATIRNNECILLLKSKLKSPNRINTLKEYISILLTIPKNQVNVTIHKNWVLVEAPNAQTLFQHGCPTNDCYGGLLPPPPPLPMPQPGPPHTPPFLLNTTVLANLNLKITNVTRSLFEINQMI